MYKLVFKPETTEIQSVKRLSDGAFIPYDSANADYQQYLKWLDGYELQGTEWVKTSEGNTPEPADQSTT